MSSTPTQLFIDGAWSDASGGSTFVVENPASGEVIAQVADATDTDAISALDAAAAAQSMWAATEPRERGELLRRAFELITGRAEDFARLMTAEMGKPLAEARGEVTYGAEFFRWFSEEAVRIRGSYSTAPSGGTRLLTLKQPVGPSLAITPWNFPLAMATRKAGAALAAGCTMVLKPAELTPLTSLLLAEVLSEAGLPHGVFNVVTTTDPGGVTGALLGDSRLRKLTFTGSTAVGRMLLEQAAPAVLRTSMELGGNAPFLVFEDADLDRAVEGAMLAKMRNIGEACTAANRFLVHEAVADEFSRRFAARMATLTVGDGLQPGVDVGPLVEQKARQKVADLVADACELGAEVLTGGRVPDGPGWFYPPTVVASVPTEARMWSEEIFGPVAGVFTFGDDDEAIAMANSTEFGLVAYAFTESLSRAVRVYEGLESGMVGINTGIVSNPAAPFGGVKSSGLGREGGAEGIEEYLETKYVGLAL